MRSRRSRAHVLTIALVSVVGAAAPRHADGQVTPPTVADSAQLARAVDSLLTESARAWNAGDLDGFMRWYVRAPETTFMTVRGPIAGWSAIRARYAAYFEPGAARDSLRFEDLAVRPLARDRGLATARCVLFQGTVVTSECVFTLILERRPEGWRILHDHSSAGTR